MKELLNNYKLIALLCLTLGLAPYFPQPHLFGKLQWVLGGAKGMQPMDWFDLVFHGFPFLLALRLLLIKLREKRS
ncbi:MAG: hypothetical protein R3299_07980 [Arenibacter sp.]|nr:hypothetical protein [Arenibacter sp.]